MSDFDYENFRDFAEETTMRASWRRQCIAALKEIASLRWQVTLAREAAAYFHSASLQGHDSHQLDAEVCATCVGAQFSREQGKQIMNQLDDRGAALRKIVSEMQAEADPLVRDYADDIMQAWV